MQNVIIATYTKWAFCFEWLYRFRVRNKAKITGNFVMNMVEGRRFYGKVISQNFSVLLTL